MKKQLLRFTLFLLICLSLPLAATAQVVDIPDSNLRTVIEAELGKAAGAPITADEMATLTQLEARKSNISDLTGLEFAANLTRLVLEDSSISDISPLAGLINLTLLDLEGNLILEVSPLAGLINLTFLGIERNTISDISPLVGLIKLTQLDLHDNLISDVSALTHLIKLTELILHNNLISDLAPLAGLIKLRTLDLGENSIRDLSPLAGLTNLTWLNLGGNLISDLSPLVGLANLAELHLHYNLLSDISPLAKLINLTGLQLRVNLISNISPLMELTKLTWLKLDYNSILDISPLTSLTNLTWLNIEENSISDLSPLVANMGLGDGDSIVVSGNLLSDISINTHIPALLSRGVAVDEETGNQVKMDQAKLFLPAISPVTIGDTFTLNLIVQDITDLAGWQLNIAFNPAVLKAVSVNEGDFLSKDGGSTFFQKGNINSTTGEITGLTVAHIGAGSVSGTGTLLSINFEAKAAGEGSLTLHEVKLGDPNGDAIPHELVITPITVSTSGDVNGDGQINVFDLILVAQNLGQTNPQVDVNNDGNVNILDLVVIAQRLGESTTGLAPNGLVRYQAGLNSTMIQQWIDMAHAAYDGSLAFQEGITNLERLLETISPDKTVLLTNYPNPFNPETWIPYHLSNDADVTLTIYDTKGAVMRQFSLGYQQAGYYTDRTKAAYWDGRNNVGESVGSGVYFYQLQVGDYSAMRKMVILK